MTVNEALTELHTLNTVLTYAAANHERLNIRHLLEQTSQKMYQARLALETVRTPEVPEEK
jgi:hypothetical protein